MTDSITSKTVKSGVWVYSQRVITSLMNLGAMAILARKLEPRDFGLVVLAQVLLRFITFVGDGGIGHFIIYDRKTEQEERTHAAFWLNLCITGFTSIIAISFVPLITKFYTQDRLNILIYCFIFKYFINQMSIVPQSLVKKSLDYNKLVIRDTCIQLSVSLGCIIMALSGYGVWSLVVPPIIISPFRTLFIMYLAKWWPKYRFYFHQWKNIFRYSVHLIVTNFANAVASEGDTLLIGKLMGSELLGIYNIAWQNANLVSRNVTSVMGRIAMPALSAVAHDMERLRSAFLKMIRLLSAVSSPLLIGLFSVADIFILTIYGSKWEASILPLRILIIYALRQTIGSPLSVIYNVLGRPDIGMKLSLSIIPFYMGSIWIGSHYSIVGVAIGVTFIRTSYGILSMFIASRMIHEKFLVVIKCAFLPVILSLTMALILYFTRFLLASMHLSMLIQLILLTIFGGTIYIIMFIYFFPNNFREIIELFSQIFPTLKYKISRLYKI